MQALGVVSIYIVFSQLAMAEAMPLYIYVFISVVAAAGVVLNFLNYFGKLNPSIWSRWEDFITVGGLTALPQVLFGFPTFKSMTTYLNFFLSIYVCGFICIFDLFDVNIFITDLQHSYDLGYVVHICSIYTA